MNLTLHSDYSLRILLFLAGHPDRRVSTQEISDAYGISRNHLLQIVRTLQKHSFVVATTGRNGGLALARDPDEINVGEVVRVTEQSFRIVECFDAATNTCRIARVCKLRGVLRDALDAFLHVLDGYTLADLTDQSIPAFLGAEARKRESLLSITELN